MLSLWKQKYTFSSANCQVLSSCRQWDCISLRKCPSLTTRRVLYFIIRETTQNHESGLVAQVKFLFYVSIKSIIMPRVRKPYRL